MQNTLIIFIKNPIEGKVKTRIAKDLGHDEALKIYKDLLANTRQLTEKVNASRRLYYSDFIERNDEWNNSKFEKYLQIKGDIGQRMNEAFQNIEGRAILIGSDCFDLTSKHIDEAFKSLEKVDLVLGPANDGGYYLIGMNNFSPKLFHNISWSTESVLSQTIENAKQLELSFSFLEELVDLDTLTDIKASSYNYNLTK